MTFLHFSHGVRGPGLQTDSGDPLPDGLHRGAGAALWTGLHPPALALAAAGCLPAHLPASHEAHLIGNSTPPCEVTPQVLTGLGVPPPHPHGVTCLPGTEPAHRQRHNSKATSCGLLGTSPSQSLPPSPKPYTSIHSSRLEWAGTQSTSYNDERSYLFPQC